LFGTSFVFSTSHFQQCEKDISNQRENGNLLLTETDSSHLRNTSSVYCVITNLNQ
ncbi:hypothetical protein L9F63_027094, partial [Diploptera punctata]